MSIFGSRVQLGDFDLALGADASWMDAAGAVMTEAQATSGFNSDKVAGGIVVQRLFDQIRQETGQEPDAFGLEDPYELSAADLAIRAVNRGRIGANLVSERNLAISDMEAQLWAYARNEGATQDMFSEDLRGAFSGFNLRSARNAYRAETIENANETLSRASGFTRATAPLSGGVAASFTDPLQLGLNFTGAGTARTVVGAAVRESVVSVAAETLLQPVIASNYQEAGQEYGAGDIATNLAAAAIFGGAFGGGGKAFQNAAFGSADYRDAKKLINQLGEDDPIKLAAKGTRQDTIAAAEKLRGRMKDEGEQLAVDLERIAVRYDEGAPDGGSGRVLDGDHVETLDAAAAAARDPEVFPPPRSPDPVRRADGPDLAYPENDFSKGRRFEVDGLPVRQQTIDVMDLETDARAMQYKGGGDVEGVTQRLQGVERWNPILANEFIVWERLDGSRVVADGHQRSGLGRRLVQSGAEDEILVNANVFREAEGWTAEAVRAQAAKKNIAEGSGDVLDTAQVFRDSPRIIDDSLPVSDENIRQARAIATLSDEAYGMVRNGIIKPNHAAVIARYAGDPRTHSAIAETMAEANPANEVEARILVGQTLEAGFRTETQQTLFGLEQRELTMLKPKMQMVTSVVRQLRDDKRVFGLLEREADRIEAAGNTLQRGENASKAKTAAQVEELLVRLATRKGPISSRLNEAARRVVDGEITRKAAATEVASDLRELIEAEGISAILDAPDPGARPARETVYDRAGRAIEDDPEALAEQIEAELAELDDQTGDMFGAGGDDAAAPPTMDELFADADLQAAAERQRAIQKTAEPETTITDLNARGGRYTLPNAEGKPATILEAIDHLKTKAQAYAGPDVARERQATIVIGPPASGKSTVSEVLAKSQRAAIVDPDDAKQIIPEYQGGLGANAVHVESQIMARAVLSELTEEGGNLVLPRVAGKPGGLDNLLVDLQKQGYSVKIVRAHVDEDEAARRMTDRFKRTGRLISPDYFRSIGDGPAKVLQELKTKGVQYAEIDLNGPKKTARLIEGDSGIFAELEAGGFRSIAAGDGQRRQTGGRPRGDARAAGQNTNALGAIFGTVPDQDGAPSQNWKAEAEDIGRKIERFEGCVIR